MSSTNLGVGILLISIGMVLGISVLPIVDSAISTYKCGKDTTCDNTDDPPASNVAVLGLAPLVLIFGIVLTGVGFLAGEAYTAVQKARRAA